MTTLQQLRDAIEDAKDAGQSIPCHTHPADDWFGNGRSRQIAAARCRECPLASVCRDYANTAREPAGVWGGIDHGSGIGGGS